LLQAHKAVDSSLEPRNLNPRTLRPRTKVRPSTYTLHATRTLAALQCSAWPAAASSVCAPPLRPTGRHQPTVVAAAAVGAHGGGGAAGGRRPPRRRGAHDGVWGGKRPLRPMLLSSGGQGAATWVATLSAICRGSNLCPLTARLVAVRPSSGSHAAAGAGARLE
jgi:hypothetical protein